MRFIQATAGIALALTAMLIALKAQAQPANDPAIVACEQLVKFDMPDASQYTRTAATISARAVTIRYQIQNGSEKTIMCKFKLDEESKAFNFVAENNAVGDRAQARATMIMMTTGVYPIEQGRTALK